MYEGEAIYYWNSVAKQVEYFYITAAGGHAQAKMVAAGDSLEFPVAVPISGGKSFGFRSRWKRAGDDAYDCVGRSRA